MPKRDFDKWNEKKQELNNLLTFPKTKRRQVWWCIIGHNIGSEQGCINGFGRPVIVIKPFGSLFWGVPITSSDPMGKKEKSPLYIELEGIPYTDPFSNKTKTLHGFVALHQMRVFDNRRLKRKILKLDSEFFEKITKKLRSYL